MSLKDKILAAADARPERVDVPEWDAPVYVHVMSGAQRDRWESAAFRDGKADREDFRARLLVYCLRDEAGELVFGPDDVPALSAKSGTVLARLFAVAQRVNKLTKDDVDELAKN